MRANDFELSQLPPDFPISPFHKVGTLIELKDEYGTFDDLTEEDQDSESNPLRRALLEEEILEFHRPRSPLDRLPAAVQQLLSDMLHNYSLRGVQQCIKRPPPRGLGININHNSLDAFKKRFEKRQHNLRRELTAQQAEEILADPKAKDARIACASWTPSTTQKPPPPPFATWPMPAPASAPSNSPNSASPKKNRTHRIQRRNSHLKSKPLSLTISANQVARLALRDEFLVPWLNSQAA